MAGVDIRDHKMKGQSNTDQCACSAFNNKILLFVLLALDNTPHDGFPKLNAFLQEKCKALLLYI